MEPHTDVRIPLGTIDCDKYANSFPQERFAAVLFIEKEGYHRMWKEWQQRPLLYLFRTAGRCYYPLVNQPKFLRHRHLKFVCNGQMEDSAEVDLHVTYWVVLLSHASILGESWPAENPKSYEHRFFVSALKSKPRPLP